MSVSAIEVKSGALAAGASTSVTISTSLVPNDRIVVAIFKTGTTGTPSASGLGTWTTLQAGAGTRDHYLFTTSGITGGGNITVGVGGTGQSGDYVVWVLRSSISAAVTTHGSDEAAGVASSSDAAVASCLANMFVCMAGMASSGTITAFPASPAVPATGYTADYTGANTGTRYASQTLTANANVQTGGTGATLWVLLLGVFSDGDTGTPNPPLTSSFTGWGYPIF